MSESGQAGALRAMVWARLFDAGWTVHELAGRLVLGEERPVTNRWHYGADATSFEVLVDEVLVGAFVLMSDGGVVVWEAT